MLDESAVSTPLAEIERQCQAFHFITCTVVIGVFCLLGLLGNVTSFLVLTKHKTETATIFLLQCLAVADGLLLAVTLVVYSIPGIYPYTHSFKVLHLVCESVKAYIWPLSLICHTITVYLTCLVTATRYMSICHPTKRSQKNELFEYRVLAVIIVVISFVYNLPRFFEHSELYKVQNSNNRSNITYRSFNLGDSKVYQIVYSNILYFPVMYIVPLVSLAYMNSRLIKAIRALKTRKKTLTGRKAQKDNITVCIIVLVCVFILCQTPALINQIFFAVTTNEDRECGGFHFFYTKISDVLVVINSSTNFIIYCLFGQSFRRIFLDALHMKIICGQCANAGVKLDVEHHHYKSVLCKSCNTENKKDKVVVGKEAPRSCKALITKETYVNVVQANGTIIEHDNAEQV